ncbi:MAG: undecaprenyl-diphosphate phosphatase [Actinomycetota bacterium]|nr:undecaprenyl-diphosphate phosphatase [Actinomycetota bacterium]
MIAAASQLAMHPISYFQSIVLGLLQGFSELFPISSLGHAVVLPRLLGWNIHQNDKFFLAFLVAVHLATAIVLLGFFRRDWARVISGLGRSLRDREISDADARLGWLLVVGTIPAGILGLLLQDPLRKVFASATSAAIFLIVNGGLLFAAERLRRRAPEAAEVGEDAEQRIAERVSWRQAAGVGAAQALALVPGISRAGVTMGGGLFVGLNNEDAAKFAFMLATPIIGAAAALKVPDLFGKDGNGVRGPALVAALCAAVTAYLSVRFLMRFFETNRLTPFAIYSTVAGILLTIGFLLTG